MDVDIDYDNLDVGAVMDQVKKAAASRPPAPGREERSRPPVSPGAPPASGGPASPPPGPLGFKARLKAKALKAMAPFFPVIRLFALPLHEEIQAAVRSLDRTNRELDARTAAAGLRFRDLDRAMEYIKLLHTLNHNLVLEVTKLRVELEGLKSRARVLEKDFEYAGRRQKTLEGRVLR
jgi:hypothetical protein